MNTSESQPVIVSGSAFFVIYEGASDSVLRFKVRKWELRTCGPQPTLVATEHESLGEARATIPPGLIQIHRSETDDPCIVETWL